MTETDPIDDWGDMAQTNMWSAYMSGITNVPANCSKPECQIRCLPHCNSLLTLSTFSTLTKNAHAYSGDKKEQPRQASSNFGAKRNSTSSSAYEEVKVFLQTRLNSEYSTSFDSDDSDGDGQETLSYDVSFEDQSK